MARIRTIKPDFFKSETLEDLSDFEKLLFIGLWTYADDEGRGAENARLIRAELFPLRDDLTTEMITDALEHLATVGVITRYEVHNKRFFFVAGWDEHQRINRPKKSVLPGPENGTVLPTQTAFTDASVIDPVIVTDDSLRERKGKEQGTGKGKELALKRDTRDASRNEIWDALMFVCRIDANTITKSARSGYGKVVSELAAVGATSQQVLERATAYRVAYPKASLTPHALLKHWASVEGVATQPVVDRNDIALSKWVNDA